MKPPLANRVKDALVVIAIYLLVAGVLLLPLIKWVASSYFEAQGFNRVTGQNISTWEAMWTDLRVQSSPK